MAELSHRLALPCMEVGGLQAKPVLRSSTRVIREETPSPVAVVSPARSQAWMLCCRQKVAFVALLRSLEECFGSGCGQLFVSRCCTSAEVQHRGCGSSAARRCLLAFNMPLL